VSGSRGREHPKGAPDTIVPMPDPSERLPTDFDASARIARTGASLGVAVDGKVVGVIHLKDIVKGGSGERFLQFAGCGFVPS